MVDSDDEWARKELGRCLAGDASLGGGRRALKPEAVFAIEGALALVVTEPGYAVRNQAWLNGSAKRNEERWPAERQAMLAAAQRAEDMRNKVVDRLTK